MTGLATVGLSVRYGGVVALDGVDLQVRPGESVGLIGLNGAGKTTLIDAVSGFIDCSGDVTLDGTSIATLEPHRRVRLGLARTFQSAELFDDLTVAEHLSVVRGSTSTGGAGLRTDILVSLGLDGMTSALPKSLSLGQQRLVGVARALMANPRILLLDEPAAGLDSAETEELTRPLRELAASGVGVLLVDHDVDFVASVCDRAHALDFGRTVIAGPTADVLASPELRRAYFGEVEALVAPKGPS